MLRHQLHAHTGKSHFDRVILHGNDGWCETVSGKTSGSVALANQVFKISWQWLASGFSGSIIQVFKVGLVVGNLAWRNVEFGEFRLRRPFTLGCTQRLQTSFVNDVNGVNDYHVVCKLNDRLGTPCQM